MKDTFGSLNRTFGFIKRTIGLIEKVENSLKNAIFLFVLGKVRVLLARGTGAATARQKKRRANEHERNRFRGPAWEFRLRATGLCRFSHAKHYLSTPVCGSKPRERAR